MWLAVILGEVIAAEEEDVLDEADAPRGRANQVERSGVEKCRGLDQVLGFQSPLHSCVFELTVLRFGAVAVPATGCEAGWVVAHEGGCGP